MREMIVCSLKYGPKVWADRMKERLDEDENHEISQYYKLIDWNQDSTIDHLELSKSLFRMLEAVRRDKGGEDRVQAYKFNKNTAMTKKGKQVN